MQILIRWTKNKNEAHKKANEVYRFLIDKHFELNGLKCFVIVKGNGPVSLDTDNIGVYEYTLLLDLYVEEGE